MATERLIFSEIINKELTPPLAGGDGDSIENDIILSVGENNLLLSVTETEYVQLFSALLNGAITTYPDNYLNVIYPIIKAGKVTFCAALLECLLNDPDVIAAIQNIVNEYTNSNTIIDPAVTKSGFQVLGNNGCDPDKVWGQVGKLVDYINQVNVDFLENFALIDAFADKYEAIIDILPVLGDVVEAVVNFATENSNSLKLSYEASYNDNLRDAIACDLFCIAQASPTCQLTLQDVINYIQDRYDATRQIAFPLASLTVQQSTVTLTNVIASVGGGVYSGDDLVYIMMLFQLTAVAIQDVFDTVDSAGNYYAEMLDSVPSNGWDSECDDCPSTFDVTYEFDSGLPAGWIIENGSYSGSRLNPADVTVTGFDRRTLSLYIPMSGNFELQKVDASYSLTKGSISNGNADCVLVWYNGTIQNPTFNQVADAPFAIPKTFSYTGLTRTGASNMYLRVSSSHVPSGDGWSGDCAWHSIRLRGTGNPVFGS